MQLDDQSFVQITAAIIKQAVLDAHQDGYKMRMADGSDAREFLELAGIDESAQKRIIEGISQRGASKRQQVKQRQTAKAAA